MHLSKREFFSLTPRLFQAMRAAWQEERRELHRMAALIRVDMINHSMYRPRRPLELEDLLPAAPKPQARPRRRRLTNKFRGEIADSFRRLFASYNASYNAQAGGQE
jgi:hypothetical protein